MMKENKTLSLEKYLQEISREPLISAEEEIELSKKIHAGDRAALEKLVRANLRFVVSIAKQYQGKGLDIDDLISEGNIALVKAASKFDASRGLRFVNYAVVLIREQIEKALKIESKEMRLENVRDGETRSIDAPLGGRTEMNLLSVLVNQNSPFADERTYSNAVAKNIDKVLLLLNEREYKVVSAYYGIEQDHQTMAEIAVDMNLKRERVRQIRDHAVRRMRKAFKQL